MKITRSLKFKLIVTIMLPLILVAGSGFYIVTYFNDRSTIMEIDYHMSLLSDEMSKRILNILGQMETITEYGAEYVENSDKVSEEEAFVALTSDLEKSDYVVSSSSPSRKSITESIRCWQLQKQTPASPGGSFFRNMISPALTSSGIRSQRRQSRFTGIPPLYD